MVFRKLKPSKKDYRKYIIKSVAGPDDYASMREVVMRRYKRIIEEQGELPSLILADGGKGQMEAIRSIVEDELGVHIPIAGMVKDGRHRTSELIIGDSYETVGLKQNTPYSASLHKYRTRYTALQSHSTATREANGRPHRRTTT